MLLILLSFTLLMNPFQHAPPPWYWWEHGQLPFWGVIGGPLLLALWLVAAGDDQILSFMHMMFLYLAKLSWKAVLEALLNQDR